MEIKFLNLKGEEKGNYTLPESIFSVKPDQYLLHELVRYYNANSRVGTASTKTRTEVSGGGRKPWKQKHTGRARQGSIRSPIWRKGGVVFGPKPRDFSLDMPKTKRIKGLVYALSDKNKTGNLIVVESFEIENTKTKVIFDYLKALKIDGQKTLFITDKQNDKLLLACRNIKNVEIILANEVNAIDILRAKFIVIEKAAFDVIQKRVEVK